jgi:hypothetical protein
VSQTVFADDPIHLSVVATGEGLSYQWFKDNSTVPVYTGGSEFRIDRAQSAHAGVYRVTVSSADHSESVTSSPATIVVSGASRAVLSWRRPQTRVDGSELEAHEIQGYLLQYGYAPQHFDHEVRLTGAGTLSHEIYPLARGTVYFRIATIDSHHLQGPFSAPLVLAIP